MTKRDLLIDFLGWYQRNTQEEGTCNEKWMDEATVDSYLNQPQLQQHGVMQAEGSDGAKGAAVGCVHNTLKYIGPWYSCETCGTHFEARAEAPSEGALDF